MIELKALEVSASEDLLPLSRYLWRHGLPHRIVTGEGRHIVLVQRPEQVDAVRDIYARLQRGETLPDRPQLPQSPSRIRLALQHAPATLVLIALSIVGFLVTTFDPAALSALTFYPFAVQDNHIAFLAMGGQYWRLLTPIFLHFGLLHIAFNMLWLWELGRRVELAQGRWRLLLVAIAIGVGSNIAQAYFGGPAIFGGMSGVDYGLLSYCWLWGWWRKDPVLHVPTPVLIAMVALMLLSVVGFGYLISGSAVANAAHMAGLMLGFALGGLTLLIQTAPRHINQ